ncbi:MAG: putative DNA transfer protein [Caudoviricetes sp.]|nr:MAG: putative DNA transfer protein [Caudoviricetes sp.]
MGLFSSILGSVLPIAGSAFGGPAGGLFGNLLGGLFGDDDDDDLQDSRAAANYYLNQIPGMAKQNYEPYINQGRAAGDINNEQYKMMSQDPSAFINKIMQTYKPSSGYQFAENKLKRGAANNAAAGGFAGTSYDTNNQSEMVNALLSGDMQQYLSNILGAQNTGLAGNELTANRGYNANTNLTDLLANTLNQQAGLGYDAAERTNMQNAATRNSNNSSNDIFSGTLTNLLGGLNGGAGLFGKNDASGKNPVSYVSSLFGNNKLGPNRSAQGATTVPGSAFRGYMPYKG